MAEGRRAMSYTVSVDRDLVKRFKASCKRRQVEQARVASRMMRHFVTHRFAFARSIVKGEGVPGDGFLKRCIACGKLLRAGDRWVVIDTGEFVAVRHESCN
jgi:hypothetical protein